MKKQLIALALIASTPWSAAAVAAGPASPTTPAATTTHAAPTAKPVPRRRAAGISGSARQYYAMTWGVDQLSVKLAESGQLVRFNYRVIDATKAGPLNEKASSPQLIDEKAHVSLQVPTMEKVGPLRQAMPPEAGKTYWMVFSNKGKHVKAGDRVSVAIGQVRIDGLIVQN